MLKDARVILNANADITGEINVTFTDDAGLPRNVTVTDKGLAAQIAVTPTHLPNPDHEKLTVQIDELVVQINDLDAQLTQAREARAETPARITNPDRAPIDEAVFAAAESAIEPPTKE